MLCELYVAHVLLFEQIKKEGRNKDLNISEVIFKSESQFNYLFTLKTVLQNSHNLERNQISQWNLQNTWPESSSVSRGVVVLEHGGTPLRQIFLSRNGAPVNIVYHSRNADTAPFRQISSYYKKLPYTVHEIWSIGSHKNHWNCCHQMSSFKAKIH